MTERRAPPHDEWAKLPAPSLIPLPCRGNYAKSAATGRGLERRDMADHAEVEYATADGNDYAAHEQTYKNFITLVKVVMTVVVIIVVGLAYFLT
jgi:Bacterial aa3 type cytochrome c oxidase subunit IV